MILSQNQSRSLPRAYTSGWRNMLKEILIKCNTSIGASKHQEQKNDNFAGLIVLFQEHQMTK